MEIEAITRHRDSQKQLLFIYTSFAIVIIVIGMISVIFPPLATVTWINGWHTKELDLFFSSVTELGNGLIVVPVVLLLLFRRIYMAMALAAAGVLEGIAVFLFKRVIFPLAERPINSLDLSAVHFVPGIEVHRIMSFPSGHTVTIFGLSVFLSLCCRNLFFSCFLVAVAAVVGRSRVYLLQHFMLDVAGGAVIGTSIGVLTFHFFENISMPSWMESRLEIFFRISKSRSLDSNTVSVFSNRSLPQ